MCSPIHSKEHAWHLTSHVYSQGEISSLILEKYFYTDVEEAQILSNEVHCSKISPKVCKFLIIEEQRLKISMRILIFDMKKLNTATCAGSLPPFWY